MEVKQNRRPPEQGSAVRSLGMCSAHPEGLPVEVLDDVAGVVGAEVTPLGRLPGGVNGGAVRVQLTGGADAALKAELNALR